MALLNLSFYNDGKSPYLEFEKIGNRIYVDFQYQLSPYDSDYYDGDVTFDMGKTERNDKVNNGFRDTLSLDFYSVVSPGKTVEGGYELNDYTDGVSLSLHFKLTSFDEQTNFTGTSKVDVVFGSIYNDTIKGGNGNDYLVGYQGRDVIDGGNGRDLIAGGKGGDRLTGGAGDDKFFFYDEPGKSFDVITDFDPAHETIWLDDAEFSPLSAHGNTPVKLDKEFFSSNTLGKARDANDYIIYESDTGKLYFDADGVGGEKGIHFATLDDHLRLSANDFMVF